MKTVTIKKNEWIKQSCEATAAAEADAFEFKSAHSQNRAEIDRLLAENRLLYKQLRRARRAVTKKIRGVVEFEVTMNGTSRPIIDGRSVSVDHPIAMEAVRMINGGLAP